MNLQEFKTAIESCIQKAKAGGLSDEEIFCEFLEQVHSMTARHAMKLLSINKVGESEASPTKEGKR